MQTVIIKLKTEYSARLNSLPKPEIEKLNKKAKDYSKMLKGIHAEMSKVIVGQDAVIENLILALATQGHVLLKGVPGLAKTLENQAINFLKRIFEGLI